MELNQYIDHTLLKADASEQEIIQLTEEAKSYQFFSCCVNGFYTRLVHDRLEGSGVKTCTVIGFPLGAMSTAAKLDEIRHALDDGADEIDMVINISALKGGKDEAVREEIRQIKELVGQGRLLKVIIETCLLTDEEKVRACRLSVEAGADFVKTSTGFSSGGATVEDVRLMAETVAGKAGVKASGGVRSREDALAMIEAGATRIGASSGIKIVNG